MSQSSFQQPLCLSVHKYSHATVSVNSTGPIPWVHISSKSSIFVVFETTLPQASNGTAAEQTRLKIVKDAETLENLDLDILSQEAHLALARCESSNVPQTSSSVAVIVQAPLIAMKYPTSGGHIRRFQIRLASHEAFYEVMKTLSRANVPTLEAGVQSRRQYNPSLGNLTHTLQDRQRPSTASAALPTCSTNMPPPELRPQTSDVSGHPTDDPCFGPSLPSAKPAPRDIARSDTSFNTPRISADAARVWTTGETPFQTTTSTSTPRFAQNLGGPVSNAAVEHTMTTSMNRFETRPATAPAASEQYFDHDLPPRRTLPFSQPKPSIPKPTFTTNWQNYTTPQDVQNSDTTDTKVTSVEQQADSAPVPVGEAQTSTKRKRAAPKAPGSTVGTTKKPRAASTRAKKKSKKVDETPVPIVEELVQRASEQEKAITPATLVELDTQALLNCAEARRKLRSSSTVVNSPEKQVSDKEAVAPPTAAQASVPKTITTATSGAPEETSTAAVPNIEQSTTDPSPKPMSNLKTLLTDLLHDPLFAPALPSTFKAKTKKVHWADLVAAEKSEFLEHFFCENVGNPEFVDLCKAVEGMWQRVFFLRD